MVYHAITKSRCIHLKDPHNNNLFDQQVKHWLWYWVAGCPVTPIDGLIQHENWCDGHDITFRLPADITMTMVILAAGQGQTALPGYLMTS